MTGPDSLGRGVRFVCGFLFGLFVGFRIMFRFPYATGLTVAGVMVLAGQIGRAHV